MRVLDFTFGLIKKFVPIPHTEADQLYGEINADYAKIIVNKESPDYKPTLKAKVKGVLEGPYARLIMALLWIPVCKWIVDFQSAKPEKEDEDED